MDVIFPKLEEIDGIPYRINPSDDYNILKNAETTPYIEFDDDREIECGREVIDDEEYDVDIEYLNDGRLKISLQIPQIFYRFIIGQKGSTKQRLEMDTETTIYVPKQEESKNIEIVGKTRQRILAAYRRINVMVATARSKLNFTHFISLPMVNSEVTHNFLRFKEGILNNCSDCSGICEDLFTKPGKLHLTIGMLTLVNDYERDKAVEFLMTSKEEVVDTIFQRHSLIVKVKGINIMNDDPSETTVLYAKVEDPSNGLLQQLSDNLVDYFVDAGLMVKPRDHVKLHITLMNSRYLNKDDVDSQLKRNRKSHFFDVRKILELYQDYDFGTVEINKIHLSILHTEAEDGYYMSSCKITLY